MAEVVVGMDGSTESADALRWAATEADARRADLVVVLVWDLFNQHHADGSRRFDPDYDHEAADAALATMVEDAMGAAAAAAVERRTVCDIPAPGLLAAAEGAALLVVGARGRGGFGGLLLGSVSQQCLHHATGPIAIVRGAPAVGPGAGRVVVGVDGSAGSAAALRWALADAAARDAVLEVVSAWEPAALLGPMIGTVPHDVDAIESAAARMVDETVADARADVGPEAQHVTVQRAVLAGGPATTLLDTAEVGDVIVVGRRGLGGFRRLLLGSVSEHVVRHAAGTVVVIPADRPTG